ncbi:MAG: FKBP-type peptidyl-prolyl cis-trans isomerase [Dysgonamonadaceae bacterium]|jgi:FKBP-type peptidyl-prolyl cis-trans isomerase SlyD|nr:FKBP-type peptidyl-prolyl cis-trans isomerase [Dysgonamonadaceae bacterium]
MKVEQNKVVSLSYKLETDGDVVETVTKDEPMQFIYGVGYLFPKFEEQLENMNAGDKFDFVLQAADAYGEIDEEAVFDLPKSTFEVDGKFDDQYIEIGQSVPMQDQEGNRLYGTVEKIGDDTVTMNFNHPLAGSVLHFVGEIVDIREVTPEDLSGSCECGCGCHDNDCSGCEEDACDCED